MKVICEISEPTSGLTNAEMRQCAGRLDIFSMRLSWRLVHGFGVTRPFPLSPAKLVTLAHTEFDCRKFVMVSCPSSSSVVRSSDPANYFTIACYFAVTIALLSQRIESHRITFGLVNSGLPFHFTSFQFKLDQSQENHQKSKFDFQIN